MHRHQPAADVLAEHRTERSGQRLDDRHLESGAACGGGDLLADEARADDRQASPGAEGPAQPPGVRQGSQGVDVREAIELRKDSRCAAGGDQKVLVAELAVVVEPDAAALRIESHGAAEDELDALVRVPAGRTEPDLRLLHLAGEHPLGERRPVVGQLGLAADHRDPALVAARPQRLDAALRGQAAADDQGSLAGHATAGSSISRRPMPRWDLDIRRKLSTSLPGRVAAVSRGAGARAAPADPLDHPSEEQSGDDGDAGDHRPEQPWTRGIRAGAERVGHAQGVDEDRRLVGPPPEARTDSAADIEAQAEQRREVAAGDPEAHPEGLVGDGEGNRDPGRPGVEPGVAEQGEAVHGDGHQAGHRSLLVDRAQDPPGSRLA